MGSRPRARVRVRAPFESCMDMTGGKAFAGNNVVTGFDDAVLPRCTG